MSFYKLVDRLREEGFDVKVNNYKRYINAHIKNIMALTRFCVGDCETPELNNRIAIDNFVYADYWENVPISLSIPNSEYQIKFIIMQIMFWGSLVGEYTRRKSIYEKIREYPMYIYNLK